MTSSCLAVRPACLYRGTTNHEIVDCVYTSSRTASGDAAADMFGMRTGDADAHGRAALQFPFSRRAQLSMRVQRDLELFSRAVGLTAQSAGGSVAIKPSSAIVPSDGVLRDGAHASSRGVQLAGRNAAIVVAQNA